jgi:hypothetical protein
MARRRSTPEVAPGDPRTVQVHKDGETHMVTPEVAGVLRNQGWTIDGADAEELSALRQRVAELETQLEGTPAPEPTPPPADEPAPAEEA